MVLYCTTVKNPYWTFVEVLYCTVQIRHPRTVLAVDKCVTIISSDAENSEQGLTKMTTPEEKSSSSNEKKDERFDLHYPSTLKYLIKVDIDNKGYSSETQWWNDAGIHFLDCRRANYGSLPELTLESPLAASECELCKKTIPARVPRWQRHGLHPGSICLNCHLEEIDTTTRVNKVLKKLEEKYDQKAMREEFEKLAIVIRIARAQGKTEELAKNQKELDSLEKKFLTTYPSDPEARRIAEESKQLIDEMRQERKDNISLVREVNLLCRRVPLEEMLADLKRKKEAEKIIEA